MSTRRQVRERVLQALYAHEISEDTPEHVLKTLVRPPFEGQKTYTRFAEKLFVRGLDVRAASAELMDKHVQNWEISRMALTDRLVIRLAVAELLHFEDIPPKVTINEAVDLARTFGSEKSGAFVNGVLDAILRELQRDGRIQKAGRGLVNTSTKGPRGPKGRALKGGAPTPGAEAPASGGAAPPSDASPEARTAPDDSRAPEGGAEG